MKVRRMRSHPDFRLEGRSRHFQSFWELELEPCERTTQHQHYESEEIVYLLQGEGTVRVDEVERQVQPGEVVLIPPRTKHIISNDSGAIVRAITVESRFDLGVGRDLSDEAPVDPELIEQAEAEARRSALNIDELVSDLPTIVDEAVAIRTIVDLFDIGGNLSEEIETSLGLDNERGIEALSVVERKIMKAVVEITGRYQQRGGRWLLG